MADDHGIVPACIELPPCLERDLYILQDCAFLELECVDVGYPLRGDESAEAVVGEFRVGRGDCHSRSVGAHCARL